MINLHTKKIYLLIFGMMLALIGCKEFLEENIEDSELILLSPGHGAEISNYSITFLWEQMDDALEYRLQVVSPDFDEVALFHEDTLVNTNRFTLSLSPGAYQWRVKGVNGSSESGYTTRSFVIYESDLTKQQVVQTVPGNNHLTSNNSLLLAWQSLFSANGYRLQIDSNNFSDEENLLYDNFLEATEHTFRITAENTYQWRVRAEADTMQSQWSTIRAFTYDNTPPAVPQLLAPGNNASVNKPVTLRWEAIADAHQYELYVYKSDSTTLFNESYPLTLESTAHNFNNGNMGERVLWRLRASDQAGNTSGFSAFRSFVIGNQ